MRRVGRFPKLSETNCINTQSGCTQPIYNTFVNDAAFTAFRPRSETCERNSKAATAIPGPIWTDAS